MWGREPLWKLPVARAPQKEGAEATRHVCMMRRRGENISGDAVPRWRDRRWQRRSKEDRGPTRDRCGVWGVGDDVAGCL